MDRKTDIINKNNYSFLITGAAGFIGSHVSEILLKNGFSVLGVDDLNNYYPVEYKRRNLENLLQYADFDIIIQDISEGEALSNRLKDIKIEAIGHIAARAGVRPSIKDPGLYQRVNVEGSLNILELAKDKSVKNLVLTSSSSVYGNSTKIPFQEDDSATDKPISPYAATKKSSEVLAHCYHHLYDIPTTIIRPFTVYGPSGRPDMAPWLFLKSALEGSAINKFGDGTTRRDYTFIDDFASGFVSALMKPRPFDIFNLGNSETVSLNEAIATIEKVTGKTIKINQMGMQAGDVSITNADISKAKKELGYCPQTSFAEGMKIFHDWYLKNII